MTKRRSGQWRHHPWQWQSLTAVPSGDSRFLSLAINGYQYVEAYLATMLRLLKTFHISFIYEHICCNHFRFSFFVFLKTSQIFVWREHLKSRPISSHISIFSSHIYISSKVGQKRPLVQCNCKGPPISTFSFNTFSSMHIMHCIRNFHCQGCKMIIRN